LSWRGKAVTLCCPMSLAAGATHDHSCRYFARQRQRCQLVVLQGQELVGIVTERDYARKIALQGRSSAATLISEVMTRQVQCVQPQHSSEACMALMTAQRVRHLPVVDGQRRLLGLISIGDIVKEIINAQQVTIQQLEEFITGMPQPQV